MQFYKKEICCTEDRLPPASAEGARGAEDRDTIKERGEMTLKRMIRTIGIAAFILLAGCSGSRSSTGNTPVPESRTTATSKYAPPVTVIRTDGSSVTMTYETISNLPLQTLTIAGRSENGPIVPDFLAAAGVTEFSQVTLTGLENRTLTFTREQLTDEYILALRSSSRAVNLMSPNLPEEQWVLHVFRVEVK